MNQNTPLKVHLEDSHAHQQFEDIDLFWKTLTYFFSDYYCVIAKQIDFPIKPSVIIGKIKHWFSWVSPSLDTESPNEICNWF
jgi:hypothetical protein